MEEGTEYILYKGTSRYDGEAASSALSGKYLRIVEQKNAYIINELKNHADMYTGIANYAGLSDRERSILLRSTFMPASVGEQSTRGVTLSQKKALSKRTCINCENILVYLPEGTILTGDERIAVEKAAKYIFNDWNRAKEEIYATCI